MKQTIYHFADESILLIENADQVYELVPGTIVALDNGVPLQYINRLSKLNDEELGLWAHNGGFDRHVTFVFRILTSKNKKP